MNKFLIVSATLFASPALAQTMPMPGPAAGDQSAMRGDMGERVQVRAQVVTRTQRMFALLDTNHDNVLDQTELAAAGTRQGAGDAAAPQRMPLDRNAMFDMIDADHNGSISRDEFARAPMARGAPGMDGGRPGGAGRGALGAGMGRMLALADANHDGRVTLQEATDAALQNFDRLDVNHDGQLTPDERAAARGQMGQMRGQ